MKFFSVYTSIRLRLLSVHTVVQKLHNPIISHDHNNSSDMGKKKFTTTLDEPLIKEIKKLAIDLGRSVNDLIEEGLRSVLKKYRREASRK